MIEIIKKHWFFLLLIIITVFRIGLTLRIPSAFWAAESFDDRLLFDYAENISAGNWLGDYNNLTLVKGISFPVFLAVCNFFCIPMTYGWILMYIIACLIFVKAFSPLIRNRYISGILYILMLYLPGGFDTLVSQRAYRNSIVPSMVLLVLSCLCGLYLRKERDIIKLLPWAIGGGLGLAFFWHIREDSIWILPFVIVIIGIAVIFTMFRMRIDIRKKIKRVCCYLIPLVCLGISIIVISLLNNYYYGILTTNDRTGTEFGTFMSTLYQIENPEKNQTVWVPKSTIEQVYVASSTFASIKESVDSSLNAWGEGEEIGGDIIAWAIRDGVQSAGYYDSAQEANDFFGVVNQELNNALEQGIIHKDKKLYLTNQASGIELSDIPEYFKRAIMLMWEMGNYESCRAEVPSSSSDINKFADMQGYSGSLGIFPDSEQTNISGWIFAKDDNAQVAIEIYNENGEVLTSAGFIKSEDVSNIYPDYTNADECRFNIDVNGYSAEQINARIFLNGADIGLLKSGMNETEDYISAVEITEKNFVDNNALYAQRSVNVANGIISIYQMFSIVVSILAVVSYIVVSIQLIWNREKYSDFFNGWLIVTGIVLSAMVLSFGVEYFTSWFTSDMGKYLPFYAAGNYVMLPMARYLIIIMAGLMMRSIIKIPSKKPPKTI